METNELNAIVNRLDQDISRNNAKVTIQKYGGDLDESFVVGTPNGYLRLGVEFLKAGLAPYASPERAAIDVDVEYLIHDDSDVQFDYFERREDLTVETHTGSLVDKLIPIVMLTIAVLVLLLAIVGLRTVVKALF